MAMSEMERLNRLVLDENRVVTAGYLLRNTPLNVMEIQELLKTFVETNELKMVTAVYFLIVENGKGKQSLIVKQEDLERVKQIFDKICLCNIYSVQSSPISGVEMLFNIDWMEEQDNEPNKIKATCGKLAIRNGEAIKSHEKWAEINNKFVKDEIQSKPDKRANQNKNPEPTITNSMKNDKTSPVKSPSEKENKQEESHKNTRSEKRRSGKKRIIVSESEESEDERESTASSEKVVENNERKRKERQETIDEDIYSTMDTDDENQNEELSPSENSNAKLKSPPRKRKQKGKGNADIGKFAQKLDIENENVGNGSTVEIVTEMNDDGMLETRGVEKAVEKSGPVLHPKRATAQKIEKVVDKPKPKPKQAATANAKQTKISNFFQRK